MMTRQTFRNDCIILKTIEEIVPKEHLVRKLDAAIDLSFIEDFGYPTTEYNASIENTNTISSSEGVIGNVEGYEPKQSSGKNLP